VHGPLHGNAGGLFLVVLRIALHLRIVVVLLRILGIR
jgi:hypothetical protein